MCWERERICYVYVSYTHEERSMRCKCELQYLSECCMVLLANALNAGLYISTAGCQILTPELDQDRTSARSKQGIYEKAGGGRGGSACPCPKAMNGYVCGSCVMRLARWPAKREPTGSPLAPVLGTMHDDISSCVWKVHPRRPRKDGE